MQVSNFLRHLQHEKTLHSHIEVQVVFVIRSNIWNARNSHAYFVNETKVSPVLTDWHGLY